MKIAIDLRPLQIGHQDRGIGAYLLNLLEQLPEETGVNYILLRYDTSSPLDDFGINISAPFEELILKKRSFSKNPIELLMYALNGIFPNYSKLRRFKPNAFFQVDYLLGAPKIRGCRTVIVAHDLIPYRFRQLYLPHWTKFIGFRQHKLKSRVRMVLRAWFYEQRYKRGASLLRRCNAVISVSENTKNDLVELLEIDEGKISVVYSAPSFRESAKDSIIRPEIKKTIDSVDGKILTYIGGTDLRRQVDELVFAFNLYSSRNATINLVLCGNEFEPGSNKINIKAKRAIEESSYRANIFTLGKITEAEKAYVLAHSAAFVYPTLYEGFGLPMLEAMKEGTPVITYKNSSLVELGKDAVLYTDDVGGFSIYESILKLLGDKKLTSSLSMAGKQIAEEFDWAKTSASIWKIIFNEG